MKTIYSFLLFFIIIFFLSAGEPPIVHTPEDIESCRKTVKDYCIARKNGKYHAMFASVSSKNSMGKKKYLSKYKDYDTWGCKLASTEIVKVVSNNKQFIVSVKTKFSKEIKPSQVNGIYNYHMAKEDDGWKIMAIMPPISAPSTSNKAINSHPGM